jgi:beta-phosphoglucomutase
MTKVKAVLFDMDGVLIDACDWHYDALNEALAVYGHFIDRDDHLARFDGLTTHQKLQMLTAERGLPASLYPAIREMKQQITIQLIRSRARPDPEHVRALTTLRGLGYRLAVCSNAVRSSVQLMMEQTGLAPMLDLMLSNEDVQRSKPDPEIYQTAAARFGLHPSECLAVEDNQNGVAAARGAGVQLLQVRDPSGVTLEAITAAIERAESFASTDETSQ